MPPPPPPRTAFIPAYPLQHPSPALARHPHTPHPLQRRSPHARRPRMCAADPAWPRLSPREERVVLKPQSWHNRTGEVVRTLSPDLWVVERGYIFLRTIDVGGRTTIVRLSDGGLFVHAPLALTLVLKRCIDQLGPVRVVVAPNTEHIDFVAQWKHFYPDATYLGPPGSIARFPHIPFTRELSRDNALDPEMAHEPFSQFFIEQAPFFNETLFVHHPTRTLLCTDFFWAYPTDPDVPRTTLAWGWAMNNIYKPVYDWILIKDQRQFLRLLHTLLSTDFDVIIPCHGDIIEKDGQSTIRNFYKSKLS